MGSIGRLPPTRVLVPLLEPFTFPCLFHNNVVDFSRCKHPGISAEVLRHALSAANFGYQLIPRPTYGTVASVNNFTDEFVPVFDGVIAEIMGGFADTAMLSFAMSRARIAELEYSFPMVTSRNKMGYILHSPSGVDFRSAIALLSVMSYGVWISLLSFFFIGSCVFAAVNSAETDCRFEREKLHFKGSKSSCGRRPAWLSAAILTIVFLLGFFFVRKLYEAYLVKAFARNYYMKPFNGMKQLADLILQGRYRLIAPDVSDFYFSEIHNGNGEHFERMKFALKATPAIEEPRGYAYVLDRVQADSSLVLPGVSEFLAPGLLRARCGLVYVPDDDMPLVWNAFVFSKNSPYAANVSAALANMVDFMVLVSEKYFEYEAQTDTCARKDYNHGEVFTNGAITLDHFDGTLILLSAGLAISGTFFVIEKIVVFKRKCLNKVIVRAASFQWPRTYLSQSFRRRSRALRRRAVYTTGARTS